VRVLVTVAVAAPGVGDGVAITTVIGVLLGVTVGVGRARRAVDTIHPTAAPSWTLRQIRPSESRSRPTIVTSAPSRTDVTDAALVPGSWRIVTDWLPFPNTRTRSGSGIGERVGGVLGSSVSEGSNVGAASATVSVAAGSGSGSAVGAAAGGDVQAANTDIASSSRMRRRDLTLPTLLANV